MIQTQPLQQTSKFTANYSTTPTLYHQSKHKNKITPPSAQPTLVRYVPPQLRNTHIHLNKTSHIQIIHTDIIMTLISNKKEEKEICLKGEG